MPNDIIVSGLRKEVFLVHLIRFRSWDDRTLSDGEHRGTTLIHNTVLGACNKYGCLKEKLKVW